MPRYYSTLEEAAAEALRAAAATDLAHTYEYGGALFSGDEGYFHSDPMTSNDRSSLDIRMAVPEGASPAGLYHTHPPSDKHKRFSPHDTEVSAAMDLPSFIRLIRDKEDRAFYPGKDRHSRRGSKGGALIAPVTVFPEDVPALKSKETLLAEALRE